MKRSLIVMAALAAVSAAVPAFAEGDEARVPPVPLFRKAAGILLADPFGPDTEACLKIVAVFTINSADVQVFMDEPTLALFREPGEKADEKDLKGAVLMTAFLAGNSLAQLDSGVKGNDPYSGLIQVFRVYRAIRAKEPDFKRGKIDELVELHKAGKLAGHVAKTFHCGPVDGKPKVGG